jgi:hypothetical protein
MDDSSDNKPSTGVQILGGERVKFGLPAQSSSCVSHSEASDRPQSKRPRQKGKPQGVLFGWRYYINLIYYTAFQK